MFKRDQASQQAFNFDRLASCLALLMIWCAGAYLAQSLFILAVPHIYNAVAACKHTAQVS